jgi:hypothetical protein
MPHQRAVIGEKIREILIAAETDAGDRVYLNRFITTRNRELPAILVYPLSETIDPASGSTAPRELTRNLELAIDGLVWGETDADAKMTELGDQIEAALHADPYLAGEAGDSLLVDVDLGVETVGDRPVGRIAMTYAVTYRTAAPAAPEGLDDLETVHATTNVEGALDEGDHALEDAAVDSVTVQEIP